MSRIKVAAVMCDDEYGCGDVDVTYFEDADFSPHWGIKTRDACTEHLCWDCVMRANRNENHYLREEPR